MQYGGSQCLCGSPVTHFQAAPTSGIYVLVVLLSGVQGQMWLILTLASRPGTSASVADHAPEHMASTISTSQDHKTISTRRRSRKTTAPSDTTSNDVCALALSVPVKLHFFPCLYSSAKLASTTVSGSCSLACQTCPLLTHP